MANKMGQWVKVFIVKPGNLNSIPRTHVKAEGEKQIHKTVLRFQIYIATSSCTYTITLKYNAKIQNDIGC